MNTPRLLALFLLAILAQGASATTIWLKDRTGQVCTNTASGNAGGVIGLASVDRNGAITMKIDNPDTGVETRNPSTGDCAGLPRTPAGVPLVFSGNVSARIVPIHMLKPGTKGAMECLDQGSSFAGVSTGAAPLTAPGSNYKLGFGFLYTDGCGGANNGLPTFSRSASLRDENNPENQIIVFNGLYHLFNENTVPEPGSLALLAAGAAGLLMLAWGRRRVMAQSRR